MNCRTGSPRFEARNITVRYGGVEAVSDFSLAVPSGSIIGLVGPNGAGKSSLFHAMSGWLSPDAGSVHLEGRDITHLRPEKRARLGMARTFQSPELFSKLTVRQHVILSYRVSHSRRRLWTDLVFGRALRTVDPAEDEQVDKMLSRMNLDEFADESAEGLPIGITRVVEIAMAAVCSPKVLLLDEPTAGLDSAETAALTDALSQMAREGDMSVVLVEHDVPTVFRISDYVYVMDFGKCIAAGPPDEVAKDPVVQRSYLGTAAE